MTMAEEQLNYQPPTILELVRPLEHRIMLSKLRDDM